MKGNKKTDLNKSWNIKKRLSKREASTKPLRIVFLIFCEGTKTELNYFSKFRVAKNICEIDGTGYNTDSLIEAAKERYDRLINGGKEYDQVWCVFDRDSFKKANFNKALSLAKKYSFNVAYSNECFEIWYLLHFNFHDTAVSRSQYGQKLTKILGKKYLKNDEEMYDLLLKNQSIAIKNASKLLKKYTPHTPVEDNPCTTVHLLVLELNKYLK